MAVSSTLYSFPRVAVWFKKRQSHSFISTMSCQEAGAVPHQCVCKDTKKISENDTKTHKNR